MIDHGSEYTPFFEILEVKILKEERETEKDSLPVDKAGMFLCSGF
jgi:hypothetical protein